jgi:hypothetical protein
MARLGQFRRDTMANWKKENPIIADGEFILIANDSNNPHSYDYWACGDGTTEFINLKFRAVKDGTGVLGITDELSELSGLALSSKGAKKAIDGLQQQIDTDFVNLDKTTIKDEDGVVQDTPFKVIKNEEFIKAIVDAEDHFLFGIQLDGSIEWSKGIPAPIRAKLQEIINQYQQGNTDILEVINAAKGELSASIIALQESKVDKEEGKSLIDDEVKECFRVIENEEFIIAVVDAENRILTGIKYDGEPYFPNHEMYSVITNEEWLYAIIDAENKVLGGFRADDGHMVVGSIDISNFITNAIIDVADIKKRIAHLSTIENDEYLSVETDADGKVLGYTASDGSHYLYKVKSETIDAKVNKEEGKSLIDADVADAHSAIEDPEGRTEITIDAENKILGYRDSEGTRHEHKISANHINLSDEAAKEVNEAFKSAGIKMENPSDFSKDSHIELPIPRIAAQVRLYAPKLPTTKQDDIEAEIEYNDKDGNYFRKPVIFNAQGASSMSYHVKNMAIDINDGSEIKFGDFPTQDSFHLKKYYIDAFRGQCIVGYWLMEQVYKSRPIGQQYPYEYSYSNDSVIDSLGNVKKDFFTGSKCHPNGFPIIVTWVNSQTREETEMGIYTWNLKKSKEVYYADKKKAENIILDGIIDTDTLFGGSIAWNQFEIRNPKSLKDINGNKYDGDNPTELSNTDVLSKKVKDNLERLSGVKAALQESNSKATFEKYFLVNPYIDYWLVSQLLYNFDGFRKNWIWCTWDGKRWTPTLYDVDSIFGMTFEGTFVYKTSDKEGLNGVNATHGLTSLYKEEIEMRYKELRDLKIFTTDNIVGLLQKWISIIGFDNYKKEFTIFDETPSYRSSKTNKGWQCIGYAVYNPSTGIYNNEKQYAIGEKCNYEGMTFEATEAVTGVLPVWGTYSHYPNTAGFYNSVSRVYNWLENRIAFLDKTYNYNF